MTVWHPSRCEESADRGGGRGGRRGGSASQGPCVESNYYRPMIINMLQAWYLEVAAETELIYGCCIQ
jgi:hypothetical protein